VSRGKRRAHWVLVTETGATATCGEGSVLLFLSRRGAEHYAEVAGLGDVAAIPTTTIIMSPEGVVDG